MSYGRAGPTQSRNDPFGQVSDLLLAGKDPEGQPAAERSTHLRVVPTPFPIVGHHAVARCTGWFRLGMVSAVDHVGPDEERFRSRLAPSR